MMKQRVLTGLLTLSLISGIFSNVPVLAEEETPEATPEITQENTCNHEHTEDCYEEVTECLHEHTEECYPDGDINGEPTECTHVCSVDNGCIKEELNCKHEHDETCGYITSEETPEPTVEPTESPEVTTAPEETPDATTEADNEEEIVATNDTDAEETAVTARGGIVSGKETPSEWYTKYTENDAVSPSNVTINLFDYWLHEQDTVDSISYSGSQYKPNNVTGTNTNAAHWARKEFLGENSINRSGKDKIHPLIFAGIAQTDSHRFGVDGFIYKPGTYDWQTNDYGHAAWRYNSYVNPANSAFQGILQSTLQDGYPALALTDEQIEGSFKELPTDHPQYSKSKIPDGLTVDKDNKSLAYLFDPDETTQTGKASYKNVQGLLQKDAKGYYYYNSKLNFAEFDRESNRFALFTKPAIGKGQFFPFNSAADLFNDTGSELQSNGVTQTNAVVSHYFGLTMEVDFYQPDGGLVTTLAGNREDMEFNFSGDDDVWVFIDGVLVADLGGIHDNLAFSINFATGVIDYTNNSDNVQDTTIQEMFLKAIDDNGGSITDTQGNEITRNNIDRYFRKTKSGTYTFRSGTEHTLSFYYLERGNQESNLYLSYNLIPPISDDIIKVDQDNEPIAGIEFALYKATKNYEYSVTKDLLATFTTDKDGKWTIVDEYGIPIDFGDIYETYGVKNYVLKETKNKDGYRRTPDIHLEYSQEYEILEVVNTWDTGAAGNFNAKIYQVGNLRYANSDASDPTSGVISNDDAKAGLVVGVPLIKTGTRQTEYENWEPMYGSNLDGYTAVEQFNIDGVDDSQVLMRARILKAALYQIYLHSEEPSRYAAWELSWSEDEERYQGTLEDLPGTPDRYYRTENDTSADLVMSYYFVDGNVFAGLQDQTEEGKLNYLVSLIKAKLDSQTDLEKAIETVVKELIKPDDPNDNGIGQVNIDGFIRIYGSRLYVPNALNAFSIRKLDEDGKAMAGVEFGVYANENDATPLATGVTDSEGRIMVSATATSADGTGVIQLPLVSSEAATPGEATPSYWVHEISTSPGYKLNDGWIPVYVTDAGIYANALAKNDGITVYNGLGQLVGTLRRYAVDRGVNVTLRDLILRSSGNTVSEDGRYELKVHYGLGTAILQYGTHEGISPAFVTDEGIGFGQVTQNYTAHSTPNGEDGEPDPYYSKAIKIDLGDRELSNLFTGSTTIVVRNIKEDPNPDTGSLKISKTVRHTDGTQVPLDKEFHFTIEMEAAKEKTYLTDQAGVYITFNKNGVAEIVLKHDESLTIVGLPKDANYTVTEKEADQDGYTTTVTGNTGSIQTNTTSTVAFENVKKGFGGLTVQKLVSGNDADVNKEFEFTVTLTGTGSDAITGKYGDMEFNQGVATFTLKDGETVTARYLPHGLTYLVEEKDYKSDGYSTSKTNHTGVIPDDDYAHVQFINTKNKKPEEPEKPTSTPTTDTPTYPYRLVRTDAE